MGEKGEEFLIKSQIITSSDTLACVNSTERDPISISREFVRP